MDLKPYAPFLASIHEDCPWVRFFPHQYLYSMAGRKRIAEKVWQEFFSDPSQWWDHRSEKLNARYPDFRHKKTQEVLWLNNKLKPPWVDAKLAAMAPGTIQSNIFSWNTRLTRYVKAGQYGKTMETFQQMQQEGLNPDRFTFVPVLNACAGLRALEEGRCIHKQIIQSGNDSDVYVGSALVAMYAKCGSIEDACQVFNKMPIRNVVSWNIMILGLVKCGEGKKALELFRQMHREGMEPTTSTFVGVLNACASIAALEEGRSIHQLIIQKGCEFDVFVCSSLVDMYAKCGSIEDAERVFIKIPRPDVVCWTAMIQGHVKCGQGHKALKLYQLLQQERVEPVPFTVVGVLNACASVGGLEEGRLVHESIIQRGWESNNFVASSLIDMYGKCGTIEDAWRVFNKMTRHDVVTWTAMIQGFVKCGQGQKALELYQQMQQEGVVPVPATFVGVLNACASVVALEEGRRVHQQIIQRCCEANDFVGSSLVDMYVKCGSIEDARRVFDKMGTRDVVSWNAMILGYLKYGNGQMALELSRQMHVDRVEPDLMTFVGMLNACASVTALEEGRLIHEQIIERVLESGVFVSCSLINMYAKCGSIEDAWKVFNRIPSRNVVSWNAMILGFVKCGQGQKALELTQRMKFEGVEPDPLTFVGQLNACASIGAFEEGRHVHEEIIQKGYATDLFVCNSLVDMYAKCGSIEDALEVFNKMDMRNVVSWNTMLGGYAIHGQVKEALRHFEWMCQEVVEVDSVTFVSLLSACSYVGLVDEGLYLFESMSSVHSISATVEHYACIVDLLGRSGQLHQAEDLIKRMACEPDTAVWMSLLGACRIHGNVEMGERVAKHVLELDPENSAGYVLLSNIYAGEGKWESSAKLSQQRLKRGVRKQPGCTWIEVAGEVHSFIVGDQEHPQINKIHAELERLSMQMVEAGYVPDTTFVLQDLDDEEKVSRLYHHSEKLAIGFGLISTPPGSPLRIFKNLRVCGDCHTAIKFIAEIVGRSIIVRDANRFHHFQDGLCSCGDYW